MTPMVVVAGLTSVAFLTVPVLYIPNCLMGHATYFVGFTREIGTAGVFARGASLSFAVATRSLGKIIGRVFSTSRAQCL